jgi:hypothetical protein
MATDKLPTIGQAMWPTLPSNSPEAQAKEAQQERDRAEAKARSNRLAADLRAIHSKIKEERR